LATIFGKVAGTGFAGGAAAGAPGWTVPGVLTAGAAALGVPTGLADVLAVGVVAAVVAPPAGGVDCRHPTRPAPSAATSSPATTTGNTRFMLISLMALERQDRPS
jgi:hypothetical protein